MSCLYNDCSEIPDNNEVDYDSTSVYTRVILPELLYEFKKYMDNNLDLPLNNYIKIPDIDFNCFYINSNNIFKVLFDNNFGLDYTGLDTTSGEFDSSGIYDDVYIITDFT